jgi:predicted patatin/cPLA2 family phospholipase
LDWFASYWFRDNHAVSGLFEKWHVMYNSLAEVLEEEAGNGGQSWVQIAPTRPLRSDGYRITSLDLRADYRHGMEQSLDWICAER